VTAGAWLVARVPDAPAELLARMLAAARAAPGDDVAAGLAGAAHACLARVLESDGGRSAALDLLAADALLTHALEAAAEQGEEEVDAVIRDFGAARLATLLRREP
jgi:hypothetical protein